MSHTRFTINIPLPINSSTCIKVYSSEDETVRQFIERALTSLAPDHIETLKKDNFGLQILPSFMWIHSDLMISSVLDHFYSKGIPQEIRLLPSKYIPLTIYFLNFEINIFSYNGQTVSGVIFTVTSLMCSKDPSNSNLYNWKHWSLWAKDRRLDPNTTVSELIHEDLISPLFLRREFAPLPPGSPLFGKSLVEAWNLSSNIQTHGYCPKFLAFLLDRIDSNITTEGIFRKSGLKTKIESVAKEIDSLGKDCTLSSIDDRDKNLRIIIGSTDVHDATGLLKQYLRSMSESVIPPAFFTYCSNYFKPLYVNSYNTIIQRLINSLPSISFGFLKRFFSTLNKVIENVDQTKMTISNLVICLSPVLMLMNDEHSMEAQDIMSIFTTEILNNPSNFFVLSEEPLIDDELPYQEILMDPPVHHDFALIDGIMAKNELPEIQENNRNNMTALAQIESQMRGEMTKEKLLELKEMLNELH